MAKKKIDKSKIDDIPTREDITGESKETPESAETSEISETSETAQNQSEDTETEQNQPETEPESAANADDLPSAAEEISELPSEEEAAEMEAAANFDSVKVVPNEESSLNPTITGGAEDSEPVNTFPHFTFKTREEQDAMTIDEIRQYADRLHLLAQRGF